MTTYKYKTFTKNNETVYYHNFEEDYEAIKHAAEIFNTNRKLVLIEVFHDNKRLWYGYRGDDVIF